MNRVLLLASAFLREHPVRFLVTALATIAASAMVVWTVSSYDALLDSFESYSDQSQGRYTLSIAPISAFRQVRSWRTPPSGFGVWVMLARAFARRRSAMPVATERRISWTVKAGIGGSSTPSFAAFSVRLVMA